MFNINISSDLAARYRQLTGQAPVAPAPEVKAAAPSPYILPKWIVANAVRASQVSIPGVTNNLNLLQTQSASGEASAQERALALKQAFFTALDANSDGTMTRSQLEQMYAAASESEENEGSTEEVAPEVTDEVVIDEESPAPVDEVVDETPVDEVTVDEPVTEVPVDQGTGIGGTTGDVTSPTTPLPQTARDALNAIMSSVEASADPVARLKQAMFNFADSGEGVVTAASLEQAVIAAGGSSQSAAALYAQLDPAGAGSVNAQQFAANFDFNQFIMADGMGGIIALPAMDAVNALTAGAWGPAMAPRTQASNPFSTIDTNNDGAASQTEVEHAVLASGGTTEAASALFAQLDSEGAGNVNATQFFTNMPMPALSFYDSFFGVTIDTGPPTEAQRGREAVFQTMAAESDPVRQFTRGLFDKLDADANGALTKDEIEHSVVAAGGTAEAANALYTSLDPHESGSVSEQQFVASLPRPDLTPDRAMALSNALRPIPSAAQMAQARTAGAMSTSMMSVLLQAQSST